MIKSFFASATILALSSTMNFVSPRTAQAQPSSVQNKGYSLPYRENHASILAQAQALGVPMAALHRALKEAENKTYTKKDVLSLFDLSQPSTARRFYLIDLKASKVTAYHSSHGKGNGGHERATKFRGFANTGSGMTPLGALKTQSTYPLSGYETVQDQLTGKTYSNLIIMDLMGTKSYNSRINRNDIWVVGHSKWYVTEGYRKQNKGMLGRSLGCIVLDPTVSNQVFYRIQGGSLMYITVGNDPIEKYL